ncbi:hypothetical protein BD769DRAFT_230652 [Suillus cothurnatus]|nr:hypothetical protein BD769DRAFT_230652 [Suillus cothurnatus]
MGSSQVCTLTAILSLHFFLTAKPRVFLVHAAMGIEPLPAKSDTTVNVKRLYICTHEPRADIQLDLNEFFSQAV